jgi:hypothetical protein
MPVPVRIARPAAAGGPLWRRPVGVFTDSASQAVGQCQPGR